MNNSISSAGKKIALFQGSFDPFTRGHQSIVNRALTIFDEVVVAVVHNSAKPGGFFPVDMRLKIAADAFRHQPRVKVVASDGLTIDVAKRVGACCLLRGVRSVQDFEYEMPIAEVNRQFSGIETTTWRDPENFPYTSAILGNSNPRARYSATSTMSQFPGGNLSSGQQDPVRQEAPR